MLETIWREFLKIVSEEVGSRVVETWFKAVTLTQWDSLVKTIYLKAPNSFVREWLISHYMPLFERHLGRLLNEHDLIIFFEPEQVATAEEKKIVPANYIQMEPARALAAPILKRSLPALRTYGPLNERYSFSTFVVGPNNSLAYAAAYAVAEKPGLLYNPLFIYGGAGLGKTHLLNAVGNGVREYHKDLCVLYQSADRFVHEFINAIRFDKVYQFEARYKKIDVLLIDDIQFLSNKEQTQEAFFHLFNLLHQSHKQIVCSSDSLPRDIAGLADRIKSRLEGGLVVDIHMASLETKIAIVKKKAYSTGNEITDEVAYYLASQVNSNIRELEGALIRVSAFAALSSQELTVAMARKVLGERTASTSTTPDLQSITSIIATHFGYTLNELRSNNRRKELVLARQVALYYMKKFTTHSLREIGGFLGKKDHSTVIHACEKVERYRERDKGFCDSLQSLEQKINQ